MELAPIVLFVYNRPWHTRQTVEALRKNILAAGSELFVFSDAPKNEAAAASVSEVRKYIRAISGFKKVTVMERPENWGLAKSIVEGVTSIVNEHGRVIVLEDDLVTSPYFLDYMNDALEVYKDEKKVMHVSGYFFPTQAELPETFFYRQAFSWGWGTWSRAWREFEPDAQQLKQRMIKKPSGVYGFNLDGSFNFFSAVLDNAEGRIRTWAVKWYASVFLSDGLCLHPKSSLVINIGHDKSGEHCEDTDLYNTGSLPAERIVVTRQAVTESPVAFSEAKIFLRQIKPSLFKRIMGRLRRLI